MNLTDLINQVRELQNREPDWKAKTPPPSYYGDRLSGKLMVEEGLQPIESPMGDVRAARLLMQHAITEYLNDEYPTEILLIKCSPGTGKTTAAIAAIDELIKTGARVGYAGPRHDFFADVVAKTKYPEEWYEWLPRQEESDDKVETCQHAGAINKWIRKGYEGINFCSGVCGWDYIQNGCPWHKQKRQQERVIFIQHQHVTLGHPLEFDVVIGDESPLSAFLHDWKIPQNKIIPPEMSGRMADILERIFLIIQTLEKNSISGADLIDLLGGAEYVKEVCEAFTIPVQFEALMSIHDANEVDGKPHFFIFDFVQELLREANNYLKIGRDYVGRIEVTKENLHLLLRQTADRLPPHVIWLDATGDPELYKLLFGRNVRVVDATPRILGNVYQVVSRANGKRSLFDEGKLSNKATQAESMIRHLIRERGYKEPALISFKSFVEQSDLSDEMQVLWHYAARGTNKLEHCDALFVLGAPMPNSFDLVKTAKMIYYERNTKFDTTWTQKPIIYSYRDEQGNGRSWWVSGFWGDRDLQKLLDIYRGDELIQAIHRVRPVNREVDIWLLTNVAVDGIYPDELLTMHEATGAPEGVRMGKWAKVLELINTKDYIYINDLMELGMTKKTAIKYMDKIENDPEWERCLVRVSGRGRPKRAAKRVIKV